MTAVLINEKLLGFIPNETPIYGNGSSSSEKYNDTNHAIIKEWLMNKCKRIFDDKQTLTYLPDKNSEFNGSLIVNNKHLFRITTMYDLNLYMDAYTMLSDVED
jgi:hypothetical protein